MANTKYYLDQTGLEALWKKLDNRDKAVIAKIIANKDAIDLLNSVATGDNPAPLGSIARTVSDEIAKIVAGAPESFDTLKEISDWISANTESAAAMNTLIQANKTDIGNIKTILNVTEKESVVTSERLNTLDSKVAALEGADPIEGITTEKINEICVFTTTLE